MLTYTV